jgi:ABC-type phosphate transport system permease subunit
MVIVLGAVIVAVPLAIMAVFLVHRARRRRA